MSGFIRTIDERKLKIMRGQFGDMDLQEVTELAQQADRFLEDMTIYDPAWQKFTADSRRWWEYAWLISCESDRIGCADPHVIWRDFLIAFPRRQSLLDNCDFLGWLRKQEKDVCTEFSALMPRYLRRGEINAYAALIYHKQNGIVGHLQGVDIEEVEQES